MGSSVKLRMPDKLRSPRKRDRGSLVRNHPATQAIATNPDLIMVWTSQTPAAGIIAALRSRGYNGKISASDVISPAPVFKKIGPALAGVPFAILFSSEVSGSPEAKKFVERYTKEFGEAPDTYSAQG